MEVKPIIILGSGLRGKLLTYRLKQAHPQLPVKLIDYSLTKPHHQSWFFYENELNPDFFSWIKPFITREWKEHKAAFEKMDQLLSSPFYYVSVEQFDRELKKV